MGVSEENGVIFPDETAARVSPPAGSHDDQQQEKLGGSFSVHWNPHAQNPNTTKASKTSRKLILRFSSLR